MAKRKAKTMPDDANPTDTAPNAAEAKPEALAGTPAIEPLAESAPANDAEADLVGLLRSLDDHGVSLVEADWRKLTEAEQAIAARWVNGRRTGVLSPVPAFLLRFSTDALKAEFAPYAEAQLALRRTLMPVEFGKPSFNKNDEGAEQVKLSLRIPTEALSDASAGRLFRWTRCRVEVSRRAVNEWDQMDLPEMSDGDRRIIDVEAEFSGYSASRHNTAVSFWLDANLIGPVEALDWWKSTGSMRVEVIGEPKSKGEEQPESEPEEATDHGETQKAANERTLLDRDPETSDRIEPIWIAETEDLYLAIRTNRTAAGKWLTTFEQVTPHGLEVDDPDVAIEARVSESEAVQARLGFLISKWDGMTIPGAEWVGQHAAMLADMRDWLNALSAGKSVDEVEAAMAEKAAKPVTVPF